MTAPDLLKKNFYLWPAAVLILIPLIYFYPFFFGFIPFPGETLKAYYPWKNIYWQDPPFVTHNFDLFDTTRAIYPWQTLSIDKIKNRQLPVWNEYAFSGTPLLANNQSAPFYPLNFLMLFDYKIGWGVITILQPILGSIFMYLLLKEYKLKSPYALWGAAAFGWSGIMGFFINQHVVGQSLIWLPLSIFSLHKLSKTSTLSWDLVFITSLTFSLLAGHLQTSLYNLLFIIFYLVFILKPKKNLKKILALITISLILSSVQIIPTILYLSESFRSDSFYTGFLIDPLQLGRLLVPKFLGSASTGNWYDPNQLREPAFIGSLGLLFLFFSVLYFKKNKIVKNYLILSLVIIFFTTQNPVTGFIYNKFSFLKTVTPVRSFGLLTFLLSTLSAYGLENFFEEKKGTAKKIVITLTLLFLSWILVYFRLEHLQINSFKKQLLISPVLFSLGAALIFLYLVKPKFKIVLLGLLLLISATDLLVEHALLSRTFTPYSQIFPDTKLTLFLQTNLGEKRFLSLDPWVLPPNTFIPYHLKSVSVYDPLQSAKKHSYFQDWQYKFNPQSDPFTRAVELTGYSKEFLKENDIKYVLSLKKLNDPDLQFVDKLDEVLIYLVK